MGSDIGHWQGLMYMAPIGQIECHFHVQSFRELVIAVDLKLLDLKSLLSILALNNREQSIIDDSL